MLSSHYETRMFNPNPSVPMEIIDGINETINTLKTRMVNYFAEIQNKDNDAYYDYFERATIGPSETAKGIAKWKDKLGTIYDVPYQITTPLSLVIDFNGLPFRSLTIRYEIPTILFGERNILPQIVFSVQTPVAYPGNIGLVWGGITDDFTKSAFHPYQKKITRKNDLLGYYKDGIVDLFCDILNRGDYPEREAIHAFLDKMILGPYKNYFGYSSKHLIQPNYIQVPITGEYNQVKGITKYFIRTWAYGAKWIPPAVIVMELLCPITAIAAQFDNNGEFIEGSTPTPLVAQNRDRRHISRRDKRDERKKQDLYDPFKVPTSTVKRDEFGYAISGDGGFGSQDLKSARKSLWEVQKELDQKKNVTQKNLRDLSHVKNYNSADEWFLDNQTKRFTVKGEMDDLSFRDRGNINLIKACKPPFVLKFARDQIRIKKGLTSSKSIELLYDIYKMGFLLPL